MIRRLIYALGFLIVALCGFTLHNRVNNLQQQLNSLDARVSYKLPLTIARVCPSVVYIDANSNDEWYGRWSGSGVIIDPHIVLTAKHVLEDANDFTITVADGNEYKPTRWTVDPNNDCGLLFFEKELSPVVKFADSSRLKLGDRVFIIGSPFGKDFFNTVTAGIVSGFDRRIDYFAKDLMISVDAAVNPGNSGGPVFDLRGRVIGIAVGTMWGSDGTCFLISSETCKRLIENAKK